MFGHDDELSWAAAAMFAATGEQAYEDQLKAWLPDPNSSEVRAGAGGICLKAMRGHAHLRLRGADRTARQRRLRQRLPGRGGSSDCRRGRCRARSKESAYGVAFPAASKRSMRVGWFFANSIAFDAAVAYQLDPKTDYLDAVIANLNFTAANPVNVSFLTGTGWRRQQEIVSQFAENDHARLPPTGIPVGSLQEGPFYLGNYTDADGRNLLQRSLYPTDGPNGFGPYERWSDAFNVEQEFTIAEQARGAATMAFLFGRSPAAADAWQPVNATIEGLPDVHLAGTALTASLSAGSLDLSDARIVWETRELQPTFGATLTFNPTEPGMHRVEAEAVLPDGRRIVARRDFTVRQPASASIEDYQSVAPADNPEVLAWYTFDDTWADATGSEADLSPAIDGQQSLDANSFAWSTRPNGAALRLEQLGDGASVSIDGTAVGGNSGDGLQIEAMVYIEDFLARGHANVTLLSLERPPYNLGLRFTEDKWAGR